MRRAVYPSRGSTRSTVITPSRGPNTLRAISTTAEKAAGSQTAPTLFGPGKASSCRELIHAALTTAPFGRTVAATFAGSFFLASLSFPS
jgi:hypothetical protein